MDAEARKQISPFVDKAGKLEKNCKGAKPSSPDDNTEFYAIVAGVTPFAKEQRPPNPPPKLNKTKELLEWVLGVYDSYK
jgi:hypothetical protein